MVAKSTNDAVAQTLPEREDAPTAKQRPFLIITSTAAVAALVSGTALFAFSYSGIERRAAAHAAAEVVIRGIPPQTDPPNANAITDDPFSKPEWAREPTTSTQSGVGTVTLTDTGTMLRVTWSAASTPGLDCDITISSTPLLTGMTTSFRVGDGTGWREIEVVRGMGIEYRAVKWCSGRFLNQGVTSAALKLEAR